MEKVPRATLKTYIDPGVHQEKSPTKAPPDISDRLKKGGFAENPPPPFMGSCFLSVSKYSNEQRNVVLPVGSLR